MGLALTDYPVAGAGKEGTTARLFGSSKGGKAEHQRPPKTFPKGRKGWKVGG